MEEKSFVTTSLFMALVKHSWEFDISCRFLKDTVQYFMHLQSVVYVWKHTLPIQTVNQYTGSSNNAKSKCLMLSLLDNFLWTKNCNYWRIHCTLKTLLSSISINRSPFTIKMPVCNHLIYLIRTDCLCIFFQKNAPPKLLQSFKSFFKKVKRD